MVTIASGNWVADLGAMTCTDYVNKIVVVFKREGKRTLRGTIKDMPIELFGKWAAMPDGERYIEKTVLEAEKVFTRAYIENDIG